jgi:lipid-binding SYLF domain-containing protein
VALDGAVVQADKSGDKAMYGDNVDPKTFLVGKSLFPHRRDRCCTKLAGMHDKPECRV